MHLLLVEDDIRLGDLVARLLGGERHLVERAATGSAALDMADAPGIDAIVLDVGLPDLSGLDLARRLRSRAAAPVAAAAPPASAHASRPRGSSPGRRP